MDKANYEWEMVEWNEWKNGAGTKNDQEHF